MTFWLRDFELKDKKIHVKTTGAAVPITFGVFTEIISWLSFYTMEKLGKLARIFHRKSDFSLAFTPVVPRPWYMLWASAHRAGIRFSNNFEQADAIVFFEDQTQCTPPIIPKACEYKTINFACTDITKSKVASVFEDVFGYSLEVDPSQFHGLMAVKSEINGVHDGRVISGPCQRAPSLAYQKLIDNCTQDGFVEDLRCPVVNGEIEILYVKKRPVTERFAIFNTSVILKSPENLLSIQERAQIKQFCAAMGLEWGGIDVLRDQQDGKIYVVDVNKTEMGPPISLPRRDKHTATTILSGQLVNLIRHKKQRKPMVLNQYS